MATAVRPVSVRLGILGLTLIVLATVWFVVWREWTRIETSAFSSAARDAGNLTRAIAQHANRTVSQVDEAIREIAYRIRHGERLDLPALGERVPGLDLLSRFVAVLDLNGKVTQSSLPRMVGSDYKDRPSFRDAIAAVPGTVVIGRPVPGGRPHATVIPMSMRVDNDNGEPAAVVLASILATYFSEFLSSLDLGPNGRAALIGVDGTFYAGRMPETGDDAGMVQKIPVNDHLHRGDRATYMALSIEGKRYVVSHERLRRPGLLVYSAIAESDIRAGIAAGKRTVLIQGVFMTALLLLLAGITLYYLAKIEAGQIVARDTLAAAIRARNEAEEANAAKSQFLATASHELRTPLNAILGFSELMEREVFGPLGHARYREYMRDIRESGNHLLALINDLLDLAKIEAGRLELQIEPVDVSSLGHACVRLMQGRATEARVRFAVRIEPGILAMADKLKLKQILLNLLSNAVKFTPAGGAVALAVREQEDTVTMSVRDTGFGMSAEEVRIALEPFGQLDSRVSEEREGTGLGLPLAKGLTELHGGTLSIESSPGNGTTVTVRIPALRKGVGETMPLATLLSAGNG